MAELIDRRRRIPEEHFDFLSMLMAARDRETDQPMSDKELIDEVLTLIVAGHETTAAALTWTWYLVSQHPEVRTLLEREADRMPAELPLSLDAAEALAYTHQVLQEALRLYPPGWLITRRTLAADELGGFPSVRAPMYSSVPTCCTGIAQFWPDPEEFKPERFEGADAAERHKFSYVPFAVGPRHCIGENIAMFEMLVHVSTMSRRFRLTPRRQRTHRTGGADQSAAPVPPHDDGRSTMNDVNEPMAHATLVDLLEANRGVDRAWFTSMARTPSGACPMATCTRAPWASCTTCRPWAPSAATR